MFQDSNSGTVIGSLSFATTGQNSSPPEPAVLSCGGIFFPRRKIPTELRTWRQIVNIPGQELSAKIFGYTLPDPKDDLYSLLQRDGMN